MVLLFGWDGPWSFALLCRPVVRPVSFSVRSARRTFGLGFSEVSIVSDALCVPWCRALRVCLARLGGRGASLATGVGPSYSCRHGVPWQTATATVARRTNPTPGVALALAVPASVVRHRRAVIFALGFLRPFRWSSRDTGRVGGLEGHCRPLWCCFRACAGFLTPEPSQFAPELRLALATAHCLRPGRQLALWPC